MFSCVSFSSILCCWLLAISWYFELPSFILYTWESCESLLLSWHRGSRWDGSRKSAHYATFRRIYILEFRGCSDRLLQEFHCMISLIQYMDNAPTRLLARMTYHQTASEAVLRTHSNSRLCICRDLLFKWFVWRRCLTRWTPSYPEGYKSKHC